MGQLSDAGNMLRELKPEFLNTIRKMAGLASQDTPTEQPVEEILPALNEGVAKKVELVKEDYQLKNIKRLINKGKK